MGDLGRQGSPESRGRRQEWPEVLQWVPAASRVSLSVALALLVGELAVLPLEGRNAAARAVDVLAILSTTLLLGFSTLGVGLIRRSVCRGLRRTSAGK